MQTIEFLEVLWTPNLEQLAQVGHPGDIIFRYHTSANKQGFYTYRLAIVLNLIIYYSKQSFCVLYGYLVNENTKKPKVISTLYLSLST